MRLAIERFYKKLPGAEIGLLFYSGHGIQVNDRNFLIPVDAQFQDQIEVEFRSVRRCAGPPSPR